MYAEYDFIVSPAGTRHIDPCQYYVRLTGPYLPERHGKRSLAAGPATVNPGTAEELGEGQVTALPLDVTGIGSG
jgi:hypothetical protein